MLYFFNFLIMWYWQQAGLALVNAYQEQDIKVKVLTARTEQQ
jgi:hypothetical protein